jgi:hypothetical protein
LWQFADCHPGPGGELEQCLIGEEYQLVTMETIGFWFPFWILPSFRNSRASLLGRGYENGISDKHQHSLLSILLSDECTMNEGFGGALVHGKL